MNGERTRITIKDSDTEIVINANKIWDQDHSLQDPKLIRREHGQYVDYELALLGQPLLTIFGRQTIEEILVNIATMLISLENEDWLAPTFTVHL